MNLLLDWTTAGPYRNLTWLTIAFVTVVILTLALTLFELHDSWKNYRAIKLAQKNGALRVLSQGTILNNLGRVVVQTCFLVLAISSITVSLQLSPSHLNLYRVIFIISFLMAEFFLWLIVINDLIARHKLTDLINAYYKEEENE